MRLLIVVFTFGLTIGAIFLFQRENQVPSSNFVANLAEVAKYSPKATIQTIAKAINQPAGNADSGLPLIKSPASIPEIPEPFISSPPIFPSNPTPAQSSAQPTPAPFTPAPTPAPATPTPTPSLTPTPFEVPAQSSPSPSPSPSPSVNQTDKGTISITYITSTVKQNDDARISIKTLAGISCNISVTLPSGAKSGANELIAKTTDQNGNASWTWKINWNTKPGNASVALSCANAEQSIKETAQISIIPR